MHHSLLLVARRCDRLLRVLTVTATGFSALAATVIMALGSIDSLSTAIFNAPVPASSELAASFLAVAVFGAMAIAERERQHIVVDIVSRVLPARVRRVADALGAIAGASIFALLTWRAFILAQDSLVIRETAAAVITFPIYPFKLAVATALAIATLEYLRRVIYIIAVGEERKATDDPLSNAGALG